MEIFYDAIHVTDIGSQVYAQLIADRLLPMILKLAASKDGSGSPEVNQRDFLGVPASTHD